MTMILKSGTARLMGLDRPIARVLESKDGGPVRRILDGRKTIYTGYFISVKADFAQMPWESRHGEKTTMILLEASSRVVSYLAQPHRLEIFVKGKKAPLQYFPDQRALVHPSFLDDLLRGVPFSIAALAPSNDEPDDKLKTVVFEIKDDRDRRQFSPKYIAKLELAKQVYKMMGITFLTIQRSEDIFPGHLRVASSVVSWRHTTVGQLDVWLVQRALAAGYRSAANIVAALGGGPLGWAKLRALHIRRYIEIDLTETVSPDSCVRLLHNSFARIRVTS